VGTLKLHSSTIRLSKLAKSTQRFQRRDAPAGRLTPAGRLNTPAGRLNGSFLLLGRGCESEAQMLVSIDEIYTLITQEAHGDGSLIAALANIQARYRYLPPEALILASEWFGVPLAQVYSVATFYNAFSLQPKGKHTLHVCMGTACHVRGSPQVLDRLQTKLGIKPGGTTRDRMFTLETVNCLGACALGPIVVADGEYAGQMTPQKADALLKSIERHNHNPA